MRILVCIDDTDNLESRGTGELASLMVQHLEKSGWGKANYITRHQLLVHPEIPYTSHNSSMAFFAEIEPRYFEDFKVFAADFLPRESAEGSDPGLCLVDCAKLKSIPALVNFGRQAKERLVSKAEAYALAADLGVHLSEHGGSGLGVIGALAGAGLRLGGDDGRLKGQLKFDAHEGKVSVARLLAHPCIDVVSTRSGQLLAAHEAVRLQDKVKIVLLGGQAVLLVEADDHPNCWKNLGRQQLKSY
jgi:hypothetical protein